MEWNRFWKSILLFIADLKNFLNFLTTFMKISWKRKCIENYNASLEIISTHCSMMALASFLS